MVAPPERPSTSPRFLTPPMVKSNQRTTWVVQAMETALTAFAEEPLDVKLVHFATLPKGAYADLEKGRWAPKAAKAKASVVDEEPAEAQEGVEEAAPTVDGDEAAEVSRSCHM